MDKATYTELLEKQNRDELILYIDTVWFKNFYIKVNENKLASKTNYPRPIETRLIRLISGYLEPILLLCSLVTSVLAFRIGSLLAIPLVFLGWVYIKANASRGKQGLVRPTIILLLSVTLALLFPLPLGVRLFATTAALLYFVVHFLYFYTALITFTAIHKSFEFYSLFVDLDPGPIWTRSPNEKQ